MHSIRSELYLLAAGLFRMPREGRDRAIYSLATDILQSEITEAPWRPRLKAVAAALAEEQQQSRVLTAEYIRLFTFPAPRGAAQPFASHWLQDSGKSALEIEGMMTSQGFTGDKELPLAPDHIVAELEFMAHLIQAGYRGAQRLFLSHLTNWTPHFTCAIRQAKSVRRFTLAAEFLDELIDWDLRQLMDNSPQRTQAIAHADRAST